VEDQAHEMIQSAADLRVEAAELLKTAGQMVNDQFGFPEKLALSHGSSHVRRLHQRWFSSGWRRPSTMLLLKKVTADRWSSTQG
jgi:hypothetical protein